MHCQHLTGTGHFVRSFEIARALAAGHDVTLIDGGRPVPRHPAPGSLRLLELPRICRNRGELMALDDCADISQVMKQRLGALLNAVDDLHPDVLIIEHFPVSKWELEPEIVPLIRRAQAVNGDVKIICSLRDIVPHSRFDLSPEAHAERVLRTLHEHFDGLLVHADPRLTRIEDHLPWASEIELPIRYTGYVSEKLESSASFAPQRETERSIIVSTGGAGDGSLTRRCIEAWRSLANTGEHCCRRLIVFLPPFGQSAHSGQWNDLASIDGVEIRQFGPDFLRWMCAADLSISHAGYNTCANILESRVRAVVVPDAKMVDQVERARILAARGWVHAVDADCATPEALAHAMQAALAGERADHDVDLDGAECTRLLLETWPAAAAIA